MLNKIILKLLFFSPVLRFTEILKRKKMMKKPHNDYGKSKLIAENLIKNWHKDNQDCRLIIIKAGSCFQRV